MAPVAQGDHYVAMGSSFAAGIGIRPREAGSPRRAGRSALNYPHLVAERLRLDLTDVSFSGATAAGLIDGTARRPAQIDALDSATRLVTITCGGNDLGYIGGLMRASLPRPLRGRASSGRGAAEGGDSDAYTDQLPETLDRLLAAVADRAPQATVVLVDYLTVLPPEAEPSPPLSAEAADRGRRTAARLAAETAAAAARAGCLLVAASAASRDHHGWAEDPWTVRFRRGRGDGAPYHPNATGMRVVADLVVNALAP